MGIESIIKRRKNKDMKYVRKPSGIGSRKHQKMGVESIIK
jgi:hypothetical protein